MSDVVSNLHSKPNDSNYTQPRQGTLRHVWSAVHSGSSWLTITGVLMLGETVVSLLGLLFDDTTITGAPAWLKPFKFGISTALFTLTVAWMIGQMHRARRVASIFGNIMAAALVPEIGLIFMQAARHTTSHFNISTPFDGRVFAAMGILIAIVFVASILLAITACFERFLDRSLGWAIRISLLLTLVGMGTGVLMTLPTPQQLADAQVTNSLPHSGAHTVGAPDGGPGQPLTGWSADHGDLRIAHFIGLHAMQGLLFAWWLGLKRTSWVSRRKTALVLTTAVSIAILYAEVLWQALRGQPLLRPDAQTLSAWAIWAILSIALWLLTVYAGNSASQGPGKAMHMEGNR